MVLEAIEYRMLCQQQKLVWEFWVCVVLEDGIFSRNRCHFTVSGQYLWPLCIASYWEQGGVEYRFSMASYWEQVHVEYRSIQYIDCSYSLQDWTKFPCIFLGIKLKTGEHKCWQAYQAAIFNIIVWRSDDQVLDVWVGDSTSVCCLVYDCVHGRQHVSVLLGVWLYAWETARQCAAWCMIVCMGDSTSVCCLVYDCMHGRQHVSVLLGVWLCEWETAR